MEKVRFEINKKEKQRCMNNFLNTLGFPIKNLMLHYPILEDEVRMETKMKCVASSNNSGAPYSNLQYWRPPFVAFFFYMILVQVEILMDVKESIALCP